MLSNFILYFKSPGFGKHFGVSVRFISKAFSVGGLIACVILTGRALAPLAQATNLLTRLEGSEMALQGLNKIMNLPLERDPEKEYLHHEKFNGDITFEDVSFNYPDQSLPALHNVSFKIRAGERRELISGRRNFIDRSKSETCRYRIYSSRARCHIKIRRL